MNSFPRIQIYKKNFWGGGGEGGKVAGEGAARVSEFFY